MIHLFQPIKFHKEVPKSVKEFQAEYPTFLIVSSNEESSDVAAVVVVIVLISIFVVEAVVVVSSNSISSCIMQSGVQVDSRQSSHLGVVDTVLVVASIGMVQFGSLTVVVEESVVVSSSVVDVVQSFESTKSLIGIRIFGLPGEINTISSILASLSAISAVMPGLSHGGNTLQATLVKRPNTKQVFFIFPLLSYF